MNDSTLLLLDLDGLAALLRTADDTWHVRTHRRLTSGPLPPGAVVAADRDSTAILTTGVHAPPQRYTIDPGGAVAPICARVGGADLTQSRWYNYGPHVPYRRVCGR
ncbi:hypothetical protein [Streptomyces sp. NPDC096311]|uniref:hypothetical protein n=1 Tax=Streptomyces sp. NPDC096311 TaxID=3366083 RepID=UPI0037F3C861